MQCNEVLMNAMHGWHGLRWLWPLTLICSAFYSVLSYAYAMPSNNHKKSMQCTTTDVMNNTFNLRLRIKDSLGTEYSER